VNLTPTETERLVIFTAAEFARRNMARGIQLSHPEAVALISDEMLLAARSGLSYEEIVDKAGNLLTGNDVMPGVAEMIQVICVEGMFAEGTRMIAVFDPIVPERQEDTERMVAGEIISVGTEIPIAADRGRVTVKVVNTGDRDIQVRSHTHFFEVNRALEFDRAAAFGMRLDTPSGVGMRFEPGLEKPVNLVEFGGSREIHGFAGLTNGRIDDEGVRRDALERARRGGYRGA